MEHINSVSAVCLVPHCGLFQAHRGLCAKHYKYASRMVQHSLFDWDQLERDGKVLPPLAHGRPQTHKQYNDCEVDLIDYFTAP